MVIGVAIQLQGVATALVVVVVLTAIAASVLTFARLVLWLLRWRSRRRRLRAFAGVCTECGYSLLASTTKCPECGTPIPEWAQPRLDVWRLLRLRPDLSEPARTAIATARTEAQRLGHDYLGTEHLLLGVMEAAAEYEPALLDDIGLELQDVREWIRSNIQSGPPVKDVVEAWATPAAHRVFARAMELMQASGASALQLRQLYEALRNDRDTAVAHLLADDSPGAASSHG